MRSSTAVFMAKGLGGNGMKKVNKSKTVAATVKPQVKTQQETMTLVLDAKDLAPAKEEVVEAPKVVEAKTEEKAVVEAPKVVEAKTEEKAVVKEAPKTEAEIPSNEQIEMSAEVLDEWFNGPKEGGN